MKTKWENLKVYSNSPLPQPVGYADCFAISQTVKGHKPSPFGENGVLGRFPIHREAWPCVWIVRASNIGGAKEIKDINIIINKCS